MSAGPWQVIRCPACRGVLMEAIVAAVRVKCPRCRRRVWVNGTSPGIAAVMVDLPVRRVV